MFLGLAAMDVDIVIMIVYLIVIVFIVLGIEVNTFYKSRTGLLLLLDCVHTIPAQFENGKKFDGKKSLQDFCTKGKYLHPKNQPVSIKKRFTSLSTVHMMLFQIYAG